MAVHVIQDQQRPWYDYIADAGTQLLGGVIKNQFDKAAEKRKFQAEQEAAAANMAREQEMIDWKLGRHTDVPDMSTDRAGYLNAMLRNSHSNPNLTQEIDTITQAMYPNKTLTNVDLGYGNQPITFDPYSGDIINGDIM